MNKRPTWFRYTDLGGHFMPSVTVHMSYGDTILAPVNFLVDTGAAMTFAPLNAGMELMDKMGPSKSTNCKDANNKYIHASPLPMRMRIDGLGEFEEVVHFIPNGLHALLGQTSFLQKVEGFFFNCTTTTRRFGLYVKGNADVPKLQSVR